MSQPSILKKSTHFFVCFRENQVRLIKTERFPQQLGLFQIRWTDFWILDIKSF